MNRTAKSRRKVKDYSMEVRTLQGRCLSHLGKSAVVHYVQSNHLSLGDNVVMSDNYPTVVRTVEEFTVVEGDAPTLEQEKEARDVGGILSQ